MSRRPNKSDFTVQEELTPELHYQVAIDFEKNCHLTWGEFVLLQLRPEYQGGKYFNACRHKFNNLKKKKKHNNTLYYADYSKLIGGAYRDANNSESDDDDFDDLDQQQQRFCSPPSAKKSSAKKSSSCKPSSKKKAHQPPTPQNLRSKFSPTPTKKMSSSISSKSMGTSASNYSKTHQFESLDDAVAECHPVWVDFELPENNGSPTFCAQQLFQIPSPSGFDLTTQVKVHLNNLTDLRDYGITTGKVVCDGRALLVEMPKLPHFRIDEDDVKVAHGTEKTKCVNTQNSWTVFANKMEKDSERLMMKTLFIFPNEMIVSADLNSDEAPTKDQMVKLVLREVPCEFTTGSGAKEKRRKPIYYPGFWLLRMISEEAGELRKKKSAETNDLDDAFDGMTM